MERNKPIDVVITWVDGNDPGHRNKRRQYSESTVQHEDIDGETRFVSVGEIAYCIASINRFAPFVRKIFIVTDKQNPGICPENGGCTGKDDKRYPLSAFLAGNFAHPVPMEIIDHEVIFQGYEEYLPTFNSLAIETLFYRIPGLSEHFVYFNDDCMLIGETSPETFFEDGRTNVYGYWHKRWTAALLRALRRKKDGHKKFTFRDSILNGADVAGARKRFFRIVHTPHALNRRILEDFYAEHPEAVIRNIRHRFRDAGQFNPQAMSCNLSLLLGKANEKSTAGLISYMEPKDEPDHFRHCIEKCEATPTVRFLCMNSLDQASGEDRRMMLEWLAGRLGLDGIYQG